MTPVSVALLPVADFSPQPTVVLAIAVVASDDLRTAFLTPRAVFVVPPTTLPAAAVAASVPSAVVPPSAFFLVLPEQAVEASPHPSKLSPRTTSDTPAFRDLRAGHSESARSIPIRPPARLP